VRTRELLLRTAERLYGQRGINGVSLREIVREAGQRNASAAHYHFGSREGLIAAIFEERMGPIDRQRQKLLDQIEADKTEGDLYRVLETVLSPLVDLMKQSDDAFHYIHFLTEMFLSREFHVDDFVDGKYNHAMRRVYLMTKAHLTDIPEPILRQRFLLSMHSIAFSLADIDTARARRAASGRQFDLDRAVWNLVDMWVGSLTAPMSDRTLTSHKRAA
jgi:AcrR family transcriptional regulator